MAEGTIQKVIPDSGSGYCKMPDGTLLQWGDSEIQGGAYYVRITYTIPFVDSTYGFAFAANYGVVNNAILSVAGKYGGSIDVYRATSSENFQRFSWIAIGRWK